MEKTKKYPKLRFPEFSEDWEQRKLGEIAENTYGGGTPKTAISEYWNGDLPWIQSSDLREDNLFGTMPKKKITDSGLKNSATKLIPANSIAVVTRVGVGKLALMPFDYSTSQDFLSLSNLAIEPLFGLYSLYVKLKKELHAVQGTSIKGITKEELLGKKIMIPKSVEEQAKIGAFFQEFDKLIAIHQRKLEVLKEQKKGLLQQMFPKDGANIPELRFPEFTGAWEQRKLGEICSITTGNSDVQDAKESGYPFFDRSTEIKYLSEWYLDSKALIYAGEGSEFFPRYIEGKFALHQRCYALYDFISGYLPQYIFQYMSTEKTNRYFINTSVGSTVPSLRRNNFENCLVMCPINIEEQAKIGSFFQEFDNLIAIHQRKLEALQEQKKGLLQQMFV